MVLLRTVRALLIAVSVFLCLCVLVYSVPPSTSARASFICLHIFMLSMGILQIGLYCLIIIQSESSRKFMNVIPLKSNPFYPRGLWSIDTKVILYLIQPSIVESVRGWTIPEYWWNPTSLEFETFDRSLNDFLIVVHFTFNYFHAIYDAMILTYWGSVGSKLRYDKFKVEKSIHFVLGSMAVDKPFTFSFTCFIFLWFYFSVILQISEAGPLLDLFRKKSSCCWNSQFKSKFYVYLHFSWDVHLACFSINDDDRLRAFVCFNNYVQVLHEHFVFGQRCGFFRIGRRLH